MKRAITLEFDEEVLARATAEADRRKTTLSAILEELVRTSIHKRPATSAVPQKYYLPVFSPDTPGRPPGIPDDITMAAMLDLIDDAESDDPL